MITLAYTKKDVFYPQQFDITDLLLEADQYDYTFEYAHRPRTVVGDQIDFGSQETDQYFMAFTPMISTQKYLAMMNKGQNQEQNMGSSSEASLSQKLRDQGLDPTYAKDAILLGEDFVVFKKGDNLDSLRILADKSYRKQGSPFVMAVDLSYLNISILNYVSSNLYGVLLIATRSTSNRISLIQFYKDFTYEIRFFQN